MFNRILPPMALAAAVFAVSLGCKEPEPVKLIPMGNAVSRQDLPQPDASVLGPYPVRKTLVRK